MEPLVEVKRHTVPISQKACRVGAKSREVLEQHIHAQLDVGLNETAQTQWSRLVLFAAKKDKTIQLCVAFGRLKHRLLRTRTHLREWKISSTV